MAKVKIRDHKEMEKLESQFAASILWYDHDEMQRMVDIWDAISSNQNFTYNAPFHQFVTHCSTIKRFDEDPETRRRHTVEHIQVCADQDPNAQSRERFTQWFEDIVDMDVDMELSEDILHHFMWEQYKLLINNVDESTLNFQEKLEIRPPFMEQIRVNDVKTLSDIDEDDGKSGKIFTTGAVTLDDVVHPTNGNFMVIAARPGVGKSLFMLNMAVANALRGHKVLFVNMEMKEAQIQKRIINNYKGYPVEDAAGRKAVKREYGFQPIMENLHIYANEYKNATSLFNKLEEFIQDHQFEIIFVDYLQLIRFANLGEWESLRQLTLQMKQLAFKNNILVVSASQVSRSSTDAGLNLSDLFGSSSIENDTDIVIGMENYQETRFQGSTAMVNIKVLKNREGQLAMQKLSVDYSVGKFLSD